MSARTNILAKIRTQNGRSGLTSEAELSVVRSHIAQRVTGPLPSFAGDEPISRFKQECLRLKSTVDEVADLADVPQVLVRCCEHNSLEKRMVGWPSLSNLAWDMAGITFENRLATAQDLIGVTDCFCAIGETGTLLLLSSPTSPKLHALLPETHVCIVSKSRIVATMEDAFARLRNERGLLPRATFFVSGPSRTADIEQTIVIGAHGPYRVHVVLVP